MQNAHRYISFAGLTILATACSHARPITYANAGSTCALRSPIAAAHWTSNPKRGAIEGTVHRIEALNDSSETPLSDAEVAVSGPVEQKTVVDSVGQFHLANLPAGTYAVTVRRAGFPTRSDSLVIDSTGAIGDIHLRGGARYPICSSARSLAARRAHIE